MPLVSIVMSVYNGEKYLGEAIESMLNQSFKDFEFIILDDASTDSSAQIIKGYSDDRIIYSKNPKNLGLSGSLNRGLELARGKYIARMDADDISMKERLEKQVEFMEKNEEVVLCGTHTNYIIDGILRKHDFFMPCDDIDIKLMILYHNPFLHSTMMLRRETIEKYNLRYENNYIDDYNLWIRFIKYGKFANLEEVLLNVRIHESNFGGSNRINIEEAEKRLRRDYINSLELSDKEKSTLIGAFENTIAVYENADILDGALKSYCRSVGNDPENEIASKLLSDIMYGFFFKQTKYGLRAYKKYMSLSSCYKIITEKQRWKLFFKCLFKDRLHKPGNYRNNC